MKPALGLALLLVTAPVASQQASVTHYGQSCPASAGWTLSTQGLPRLGMTLTVMLPAGGGRWCAGLPPNWSCAGPDILLLGASRSTVQVMLPGLSANGCLILSPYVPMLGDRVTGNVDLLIPNNPRLLGLQFNLQGVSPRWSPPWVLSDVLFSDAVECVIGP